MLHIVQQILTTLHSPLMGTSEGLSLAVHPSAIILHFLRAAGDCRLPRLVVPMAEVELVLTTTHH